MTGADGGRVGLLDRGAETGVPTEDGEVGGVRWEGSSGSLERSSGLVREGDGPRRVRQEAYFRSNE